MCKAHNLGGGKTLKTKGQSKSASSQGMFEPRSVAIKPVVELTI